MISGFIKLSDIAPGAMSDNFMNPGSPYHYFKQDIIDTGTSYILGNPIKYTLKPERYEGGKESEQFKKDTDFFDSFCDVNNVRI